MKKRRLGVMGMLAVGLALGSMGVLEQAWQSPDDGQTVPAGGEVEPGGGLLPIDESMLEIAAATGGDYYFWSPGEFARSDLRIPVTGEAVVLCSGDLGPGVRSFPFWVDGLTGRLDVFVGAQRLDEVRILRPLGEPLHEKDPDVDLQVYERMRIVSIDLPEPGEWRVEIGGGGSFSLSVHSSVGNGMPLADPELAPIQLLDLEFVEIRGRPGHEGYFPLKRPVAPGERHRVELELCGSFSSADALLVGLDGQFLGRILLDTLDRSQDDHWVTALGECVVPNAAFRVLVQGIDATGARYQRLLPSSVLPATGR